VRRNLLYVILAVASFIFVAIGWTFLLDQSRKNMPITLGQDNLIRLHVLANSDNPEDQQLKLKVRDAVIAYLAPQLEHVTNTDDARQKVIANQDKLADIAKQVIVENGAKYSVDIQIGMFEFPVKSYGNFVLPAGKYEAVRILIGNAEGKNWWCVLFPPLCFIDITNAAAVPVAEVKEGKESQHLNNEVEFRWKLSELWNQNVK